MPPLSSFFSLLAHRVPFPTESIKEDRYLFSIIPCSFCMFPFSTISTVTEFDADSTEILELDMLFEASAAESDKPEYFSH